MASMNSWHWIAYGRRVRIWLSYVGFEAKYFKSCFQDNEHHGGEWVGRYPSHSSKWPKQASFFSCYLLLKYINLKIYICCAIVLKCKLRGRKVGGQSVFAIDNMVFLLVAFLRP